MQSGEELRREAEATERLAATVSYRPDKQRLVEMADDLRRRADAADAHERRSWKPKG